MTFTELITFNDKADINYEYNSSYETIQDNSIDETVQTLDCVTYSATYPINGIHEYLHYFIKDNYNQDLNNKYASLLSKFYIALFLPTVRIHSNPFLKSCYVKDSKRQSKLGWNQICYT